MKILYNMPALRTSVNISRADRDSTRTALHLSSGLNINYPRDNPANYSISQRMVSQINGTAMAGRSSANIISVVQTADGALSQINNALQRIRELTVQAANGQYTFEDTELIQREIDTLLLHIDQSASAAEFNRMRILGGGAGRVVLVDSPNENTSIEVLQLSHTTPLGAFGFDVISAPSRTFMTANTSTPLPNSDLDNARIFINGVALDIAPLEDEASLIERAAKVLLAAGYVNIPPANGVFGSISAIRTGAMPLDITGEPNILAALGLDAPVTVGQDAVIDNLSGIFNHSFWTADGGSLSIKSTLGYSARLELHQDVLPGTASIRILDSPLVAQTGANADTNIKVNIPRINTMILGVEGINVSSHQGAQEALIALDNAISFVSEVRANIGATQNRLEYALSTIDSTGVNLEESLSRIRDADMALEITRFTASQLKVQAGTSILAHLNARPQALLQLLPM